MLRKSNLETKDAVQSKKVATDDWKTYFRELYVDKTIAATGTYHQPEHIAVANITITQENIRRAIVNLKNRKAAGPNQIINNMLKYGGELNKKLKKFLENVIIKQKITTKWNDNFVQGDK